MTLTERIQGLGGTADYFHGVQSERGILPGNLICFSHPRVAGPGRAYHHRFVLLQNHGNRGVVWLDDQMLPFGNGDILLIFPFQHHGYLDIDDASAWLFTTFEIAAWEHLAPLRNQLIPSSPRLEEFTDAILKDYTWVSGKTERQGERLSLSVAIMLEECLRLRATDPMQDSDLTFPTTRLDVLQRLQRLIFTRIDQPIAIDDLATDLHVSAAHLRFLFRREFGTSLGRHIREMKMARATKLLATTELSVGEIGEQCGYDTVFSFSRAFKSDRDESPLAYRRRHQRPVVSASREAGTDGAGLGAGPYGWP